MDAVPPRLVPHLRALRLRDAALLSLARVEPHRIRRLLDVVDVEQPQHPQRRRLLTRTSSNSRAPAFTC